MPTTFFNAVVFHHAKSPQSCPTLCNPIDGSPPGSAIPVILQARTLEWAAISFSKAWKWKVKSESEVAQLRPTLSDPMDCSLTGSSIHGILLGTQARVLECSSWERTQVSWLYSLYCHYSVSLDCFPVSTFPTSQIKLIWLQFSTDKRQVNEMRLGGGWQASTIGSCCFSNP